MIDQNRNIVDIKDRLMTCLHKNSGGYQGLRRRAVLNYFEDWLDVEKLVELTEQIKTGRLTFGEQVVEIKEAYRQASWSRDRVQLSNNFMEHAGQVFTVRVDDRNAVTYDVLLAPEQPYYPDITEAARHWLPLTVYHGSADARNGDIILLLPETRAYFADSMSQGETLDVRIHGTKVDSLSLLIKGAWWEDGHINHFESWVTNHHANLPVPETANRLEYFLTDSQGEIYDFQREDGYRHGGLGRMRLTGTDTDLVNLVREACRSGEGSKIEFKPFIDPNITTRNGKWLEIAKTVVAFSNAQGGRIFLGIDDDCALEGIDNKLAEWAKGSPTDEVSEKYLGALRARIRDVVVGDPSIHFSTVVVDGARVAVITVSEAKEKPTHIRQDNYLYIRRGSSNAKASPDEFKNIICVQENDSIQWPKI